MGRLVSCLFVFALSGCRGALSLTGWEPLDDDDAADDDLVGDDDAGDDDDTSFPGGAVTCGDAPAPGPSEAGRAVSAWSVDAQMAFDFDADELEFGVAWTGCAALHLFAEDGTVVCGIRYGVAGGNFVAQRQSSSLVARLRLDRTQAENTCWASHPEAGTHTDYVRVRVPYESGTIEVRRSDEPDTPSAQMQTWGAAPYTGQGPEPELVPVRFVSGFDDT